MDRYLLRYFLAVVDQGNFSKAAMVCNVSQPTLSVGIAKLEAMLKKPLFLRTNRRVELTEAGAILASHARRIEAEFGEAERRVRSTSATRTIRLGLLATMPSLWIEHYLHRLLAAETDDRVEIVEGRERDIIERLARGRIDLAFTIVRPGNDRFEREPLFREGYALAMASGHRLAGRDIVEADELVNDPMIVRRQCELLPETSRYFTARGVRPFFPARTANEDRALAYVRSGLGVTIMPDCYTGAGIARAPLAGFDFVREIGFLYAAHSDPAELRLRPAMRLLVETVETIRAGETAGWVP